MSTESELRRKIRQIKKELEARSSNNAPTLVEREIMKKQAILQAGYYFLRERLSIVDNWKRLLYL